MFGHFGHTHHHGDHGHQHDGDNGHDGHNSHDGHNGHDGHDGHDGHGGRYASAGPADVKFASGMAHELNNGALHDHTHVPAGNPPANINLAPARPGGLQLPSSHPRTGGEWSAEGRVGNNGWEVDLKYTHRIALDAQQPPPMAAGVAHWPSIHPYNPQQPPPMAVGVARWPSIHPYNPVPDCASGGTYGAALGIPEGPPGMIVGGGVGCAVGVTRGAIKNLFK